MKKGFTILELLVASLLLAMLVTMLSMMFNQSSISWRTGVASVTELSEVRERLSKYHFIQDELLPGIGQDNVAKPSQRDLQYQTVSVWDLDSDKGLRSDRTVMDYNNAQGAQNKVTISMSQAAQSDLIENISGKGSRSADLYIVGVRSAGPDRTYGTDDDITNWPEEVEK